VPLIEGIVEGTPVWCDHLSTTFTKCILAREMNNLAESKGVGNYFLTPFFTSFTNVALY
jgi:hypothetical protein